MLYWPIASARRAWIIGGMWSILTLAFGIGRFVLGRPWSTLLHDFDLLAGRVWVFIPLWVFLAPVILMRMKERRHLVS
jgi:TM2 domain-containing membrane protein YozV